MESMNDFLRAHSLPQPSQADPMLTSASTLFLSTRDGAERFEAPSEAAKRCSSLIKSLLEDAEDTEGAAVFPMSVESATVPAVAMVASWLRSSSALAPPASATIPVHDVSQNPGTTGQRGSKIVAAAVKDPWVQQVLEKVFPPMMHTITVDRRDVPSSSVSHANRAPRASAGNNATSTTSLAVCVGIHGLSLLYAVTQLAGFLGLTRMAELCAAYILHGLQEAIRDERAFGVDDHRRAAAAAAGGAGACDAPPPPGHGTTHFAVDVVRRSLEAPPAQWGASLPLPPMVALHGADPHSMVGWLRETCTGMHLGGGA